MLSRNSLNPADIVVLYKLYTAAADPPPVELIRIPQGPYLYDVRNWWGRGGPQNARL